MTTTLTTTWRQAVLATLTLATLALLLYTIGAPHEHGG
jgi:membrane-bound ClpP family serine protease